MHAKALLSLVAAALLLVMPAPASAGDFTLEDWKKDESSWKGFKPGTMIHKRTTSEYEIPGMANTHKTVMEEKETLKSIDATKAVITVERKVNGTWMPSTTRTEKISKGGEVKLEKAGTESLTVEGKSYECTKYNGTRKRDGKEEKGTFWVHGDQVLKFEGAMDGGRGQKITWTVTKMRVTRVVGTQTLTGREVAIKGPGMQGTQVISADVPGGTLFQKMSMNRGATKGGATIELIGFTKK